jgi:hypothetical protein
MDCCRRGADAAGTLAGFAAALRAPLRDAPFRAGDDGVATDSGAAGSLFSDFWGVRLRGFGCADSFFFDVIRQAALLSYGRKLQFYASRVFDSRINS